MHEERVGLLFGVAVVTGRSFNVADDEVWWPEIENSQGRVPLNFYDPTIDSSLLRRPINYEVLNGNSINNGSGYFHNPPARERSPTISGEC